MGTVFKIVILLCLLSASIAAQNTAALPWVSFESDNRDISFSMPPGYLVDTKKRFQHHKIGLFAFSEGVRMDFRIFNNESTRYENQTLSSLSELNVRAFEIGNMQGTRFVEEKDKKITETIYLVTKSWIYVFTVVFDQAREDVANRFLFSIWVKDEQLFQQAAREKKAGKPIRFRDLSSSPEVLAAYRSKPAGEIKVNYEPLSAFREPVPRLTATDRSPVVLDKPMDFNLFPVSRISVFTSDSKSPDKFLVNFLANGSIGNITVFSKGRSEYHSGCVELLKKAKFVPALVGDKNVDMSVTEECVGGVGIFPMYERPARPVAVLGN
jgi:hypothetical protein